MSKFKKEIGMLLGVHCGDSLGANLEFSEPRLEDNLQMDIVGGGGFSWRSGEPTDDTQMMICLLESISEKEEIHLEDISQNYLAWYLTRPKDIGNTITRALSLIQCGYSYIESGQKSQYSQGNGSLMRCAPLALMNATVEEIKGQCAITHAHKNCLDSDVIFIQALKDALEGREKEGIFQGALNYAKRSNLEIYELLLKVPMLSWRDIYTEGFVIETLAYSFFALLNYDSFEESLIRVVNRGGDADTLGAVTGALCGAYYGVDAIPDRWMRVIEERERILKLYKEIK